MADSYDVVIIGAGPAGLAAARTIARAGARTALVDKMGPGGQLLNIGEIRGSALAPAGTRGPDLIATLVDEVTDAGCELLVDEVTAIAPAWTVTMLDQEVRSSVVVLATGMEQGTTGLANEAQFKGHGVSHCAECDGPLYAGKRVVVAGSDRWAIEEAIDLASVAGHVTLVTEPGCAPLSEAAARPLDQCGNLTCISGRIADLKGAERLEEVVVEGVSGRAALPAAGLFVYSNRRAATGIAGLDGVLSQDGFVVAQADGTTAAARLVACGDVRMNAMHCIDAAIADGERAGQNALRQLAAFAGR
jgi:thioredoxin reductase (NADPH)